MPTHTDHPHSHSPRPPDGVLPCGCTTDVVDDLWARAGRAPPPGRSLWSAIEAHVAQHLGPFAGVIHDPNEGRVWGDVLIYMPSTSRPSIDLVTVGMSARRMRPPRALRRRGAPDRAELVMRFAPGWVEAPLGPHSLVAPDRIWVLRWLQSIPRFPDETRGFLGDAPGLDVAYRVIPLPREPEHPFGGAIVADPRRFGRPFPALRAHPRAVPRTAGTTRFLSLIPLFPREVDFALSRGPDRLLAALVAAGIDDVVRRDRAPVDLP